ncbi:MAG: hypothetical protein ABSC47_11425 [Terracidiphilus sp.]|jgi:hypothetical protein
MATPPIPSLLEAWSLTSEELSEILSQNPGMRGLMFGFVAEYKLKKLWLERPEIENLVRPRSHDRTQKCDFRFDYKGTDVRVEVKCLDTPKVKEVPGGYEGTFQCNASDKTPVNLPNGETVNTNCLVVGGFDMLAVCLYSFGNVWRFAFALNDDLPRSTWRGYTLEQQQYLLPSSMKISWPLRAPFADSPFGLLDRLVAERARR